MPEVSEAAKQLRVLSWLDGLEDARRRLAYVRDKLEELDAGMDGLGCAKYRKDGVRVTYMPDKIGAMVAAREDARAALTAEAEQLEGRLRDGARAYPRAVAVMVYDSDPARFPPTIGEIVDERSGGYGFGYWTSKGDGNAV